MTRDPIADPRFGDVFHWEPGNFNALFIGLNQAHKAEGNWHGLYLHRSGSADTGFAGNFFPLDGSGEGRQPGEWQFVETFADG